MKCVSFRLAVGTTVSAFLLAIGLCGFTVVRATLVDIVTLHEVVRQREADENRIEQLEEARLAILRKIATRDEVIARMLAHEIGLATAVESVRTADCELRDQLALLDVNWWGQATTNDIRQNLLEGLRSRQSNRAGQDILLPRPG
jgi:hypothetical protein